MLGEIRVSKPLLKSAFFLMDTHGMPLSLIIQACNAAGWICSVPHYYRDALAAGWKPETALVRIQEALSDVGCDPAYVDAAVTWLRTHRELPDDG